MTEALEGTICLKCIGRPIINLFDNFNRSQTDGLLMWHLNYSAAMLAAFFLCRLTYLSRVTTAAGVIPGMRLAQPIEAGLVMRSTNHF